MSYKETKRLFNELWNKIFEQEEYLARDLNSKNEPNRNSWAEEHNKQDE